MASVLRERTPFGGRGRAGARSADARRAFGPGAGTASDWPWLVLLAVVVASVIVGLGLFVAALAEPAARVPATERAPAGPASAEPTAGVAGQAPPGAVGRGDGADGSGDSAS